MLVALAGAALAAGGCAPWLERPLAGLRGDGGAAGRSLAGAHPRGPTPPFDTPPPCRAGPLPSRTQSAPRDAVSIGPVLFAGLRRARTVAGAGVRVVTVPAVVPPATRATIAVDLDDRDVAGLATGPAGAAIQPHEARRAIVCSTGPAQRTFAVSFVVAGARCLDVAVVADGRTHTRAVGFGRRRCR